MKASAFSVFEVGLRDGLQSEAKIWTLPQKEELAKLLIKSGLPDIEVGSFVRADRIPQLQDTGALLKSLVDFRSKAKSKVKFWSFIPNMKGLELALEAQTDGCSFFVASSDTFCKKNVNKSQADILRELEQLLKVAKKNKKASRIYLSTIVYCPYEGVIQVKQVQKVVAALLDMGANEVVLSDTTGHAQPATLAKLLSALLKKWNPKKFALHLHDTRGLALTNIQASMDFGITRFDSSVAGMGGCPYAPGASGNLASEDLVYFLQGFGGLKNISLELLGRAGLYAESILDKKLPSKVLRSLESKLNPTPSGAENKTCL